jgi:hypothetical protein
MIHRDSKIFNQPPYYDDFNEDKKFLRMLFRPGYSVQARELTQAQTILQNQIERVGKHLFEEGAKIIGGDATTQNAIFVRFSKLTDDGEEIIPDEWVGYNITSSSSSVEAKVLTVEEPFSENDDYYIFVVQVVKGDSFASSSVFSSSNPSHIKTISVASPKRVINSNGQLVTVIDDATNKQGISGIAKVVSVNEGIFFSNGFFVKNPSQTIAVSSILEGSNDIRDFTRPTASVGFDVVKKIVTSETDPSLKDPANGTFNYNAPGADRYVIDLTLTHKSDSIGLDAESFIELLRFDGGKLSRKVLYTDYAVIEETFARRTYDESGSYIVRDFPIDIKEHSKEISNRGVFDAPRGDVNKLAVCLGAGKAYMFGYEFETQSNVILETDKARAGHIESAPLQDNTNFILGHYFVGEIPGGLSGEDPASYGFSTLITSATSNLIPPTAQNGIISPIEVRFFKSVGITGASGDVGLEVTYESCGSALLYHYVNDYPTDTSVPNPWSSRWRFYVSDLKPSVSGRTIDEAEFAVVEAGLSGGDYEGFVVTSNDSVQSALAARYGNIIFAKNLQTFAQQPYGGYGVLKRKNITPSLVFELPQSTVGSLVRKVEYQTYGVNGVGAVDIRPFDAGRNYIEYGLGNASSFKWLSGSRSLPNSQGFISVSEELVKSFYTLTMHETNNWGGADQPSITTAIPLNLAEGWQVFVSVDGTRVRMVGPSSILNENFKYVFYGTLEASQTINESIAGDAGRQLPVSRRKILRENETQTFTASTNTSGIPVLDPESGNYYFELRNSDVITVNNITLSGVSVTNDFVFDNGQRDILYDYARLYIKNTAINKYLATDANGNVAIDAFGEVETIYEGDLVVTYDWFEHDGRGPIVVNSYPSIDLIPVYTSPRSGKTVQLSNCIDFRFVKRTKQTNIPQIAVDSFVPRNVETTQTDIMRVEHDYYVGRIDKVVLSKKLNDSVPAFEILHGIPSLEPVAPSDREDSISIYQVVVPPYTFNPEDVRIQYLDNKRYTMRDIGKINKRIENLESFSVLSDIENDTQSKSLLVQISATGEVEGFKNAIFVDTFQGHNMGDVANNDYRCSIDFDSGTLHPSFISNFFELEAPENQVSPNLLLVDDNNILRPIHATADYINQNTSSEYQKVNPFGLANWVGTMSITPFGDSWYDKDYRPVVRINTQGESDAWNTTTYFEDGSGRGHGSQWNDWKNIWFGNDFFGSTENNDALRRALNVARGKNIEQLIQRRYEDNLQSVSREAESVRDRKYRLSVQTNTIPQRLKNIIGDKIIDISVVPFIRAKTLRINVEGLKPNTRFYCFFDGINVTDQCYIENSTSDIILSDDYGRIQNLLFDVPPGTFEVGEKVFRVIDEVDNEVQFSFSSADAVYFAQGKKRTRDNGIFSIRPPVLRRQTTTSERLVKDSFTRDRVLDTSENFQYIDPMAQTISVTEPNGIMLDSIDLFFANKPASNNNLPITLQIRPTINQTAHSSAIVPFSEVVLYPEDVIVNDEINGPVFATRFNFTTPVYLEQGEWAICLLTNTDEYEVYTSEVGRNDLITNSRISKHLKTGVMFEAQNSSLPVPINNKSLMFKVWKCSYPNGTRYNTSLNNIPVNKDIFADIVYLHAEDFIPSGTDVTYTINSLGGQGTNIGVVSTRTNVPLPATRKVSSSTTGVSIALNLTATNNIAPMVDLSQTGLLVAKNYINLNTEYELDPTVNGSDGAFARYISRRILLEDSSTSNQLQCILSINKPSNNNDVKVYIKAEKKGSLVPFDDNDYIELESFVPSNIGGQPLVEYRSRNSDEYKDFYFRVPFDNNPFDGIGNEIKSFAVKVVLLSNDSSQVPTIKNLRAIALTTP